MQHRLYINGSAILDVVGDRKQPLNDLLAEDVRNFGIVLLQTICRSAPSLSSYCQSHSLSLSLFLCVVWECESESVTGNVTRVLQ